MDNSNLRSRFSHELNEIGEKLRQLKEGRILEFTKTQSDGYLSTNAKQLEDLIEDLLLKIEGKRSSFEDELGIYFGNANRTSED